jgi:hypothetical protein
MGLARTEIEGITNVDLTAAGLETQGIPDLLAAAGLSPEIARFFVIAVFAGGLLWFCFKSNEFRHSRLDVAAGLIIGTLVPIAWFITGVLGRDDFDPVPLSSLTFVAPVGEGLQYLMTFTGSTINFGIAVIGGVVAGSFIMAKASGQFRVESFTDATDMVRHMVGGAIMGIGGVMALGCTIGQGITGMSTLALGSLIALISIIAGGVVGMKYIEEGSLAGALSAMFSHGG